MKTLLSWNCRGSAEAKLEKLKATVTKFQYKIVCLQELQTNFPSKSLATLFPSKKWITLFTGNVRNLQNGDKSRMGGLFTAVRKKGLSSNVSIVDMSSDLTTAHLITFADGKTILHLYQRPCNNLWIDEKLIEDSYDFYVGDTNGYLNQTGNKNLPRRYEQLFEMQDSGEYEFLTNFYSYGNYYDEQDSRLGPDHFIKNSKIEEFFLIEPENDLIGVSDHIPLAISGQFCGNLVDNYDENNNRKETFYFDYQLISDEYIRDFWDKQII